MSEKIVLCPYCRVSLYVPDNLPVDTRLAKCDNCKREFDFRDELLRDTFKRIGEAIGTLIMNLVNEHNNRITPRRVIVPRKIKRIAFDDSDSWTKFQWENK